MNTFDNIPLTTNPSEFERLKPINTYKKIREMEDKLNTITIMVGDLHKHLNSLKESFLKGE